MKKTLFYVILISLFCTPFVVGENITSNPGQIFPGTVVNFGIHAGNPSNISPAYKWDFGDNTPPQTSQNQSPTHTYKEPGNYNVTCTITHPGGPPAILSMRLTVTERRTVEPKGNTFKAGTPVLLESKYFVDNSLNWDFGDNTITNGQKNMEHTYRNPGNYTVKVKDYSGHSSSVITCTVNIAPDNRSITMNPQNPSLYDEVTFNAVNFPSGSIEWDFDRGNKKNGGPVEKHIFTNMGTFKIKARESGSSTPFVTLNISVNRDKRKISTQPNSAFVGQDVSIKLQNSSANTVKWKIGKENPINNSPLNIMHKFKSPGRIEIIAEIQGQSPVRGTISINENRKIESESKYLFEKGELKFTARRFNTPSSLKWDFGDGTVRTGNDRMIFRYKRPGNFTIKVYDFNGSAVVPVKLRVKVIRDNREIVSVNKKFFENTEIEFNARGFIDNRVKWNFGDGIEMKGSKRIKHKYNRAGTYRIYAIDMDGKGDKKIDLNVTVLKDTRNFQLGDKIIAGVPVSMQITNSQGGNFEWKLPGGKISSGQRPGMFVFSKPGMQTIVIKDRSGIYPPVTKTINVQQDNRSLEIKSDSLLIGDPLKITLKNFIGKSVKYDFGDGTSPEVSAGTVTHKYISAGSFVITVMDFKGAGKKHFKKTVTINEQMDDFQIIKMEFTFNNGKYFRLIPRKSFSPGYVLKLNFRGRGILTGNWIFDGHILGIFTKLSSGRNQIIFKGNELPKLPVLDSGIHSLSFEFTNFRFKGRIPILRYFVTNGRSIKTISPSPGAKFSIGESIRLKWKNLEKGDRFQIAVSKIPFQFLSKKNIKWKDTGENNYFDLDTDSYTKGAWIYWQVRILDATNTVSTMSEISYFRLLKNRI